MTSLFLCEGVWARNNTTLSSQYFTGCQCVPTRANQGSFALEYLATVCLWEVYHHQQWAMPKWPGQDQDCRDVRFGVVGVNWMTRITMQATMHTNTVYIIYCIYIYTYIYIYMYTYLYKLPSSFWHVTTAACLGMSFVSHELKPAEHFHWAWWRCSWFPRWLSLWRPFLVAQPSAVIKLSFWERKTLGPGSSLWCSQRESQVGHSVGPENSLECCFFCLDCLEC